MSEIKHRVFWIEPLFGNEARVHDNVKAIAYKAPEQIIKVVEHTALVELQAKLDFAEAQLQQDKIYIEDLLHSYDSLKEKSDKLARVLKDIDVFEGINSEICHPPKVDYNASFHGIKLVARQALAEYDQRGEDE